ncbi:hypothetical protein EYF80_002452 [Liparis tanakae]|uniref:Uncharacterized protein n=1 Tax=Liparis tanakae TaxID=230148 RepID=A0A4Z2JAX1_9TELE|nr:hypothetical protein EYF80_002452 [Liparis tanakae]
MKDKFRDSPLNKTRGNEEAALYPSWSSYCLRKQSPAGKKSQQRSWYIFHTGYRGLTHNDEHWIRARHHKPIAQSRAQHQIAMKQRNEVTLMSSGRLTWSQWTETLYRHGRDAETQEARSAGKHRQTGRVPEGIQCCGSSVCGPDAAVTR